MKVVPMWYRAWRHRELYIAERMETCEVCAYIHNKISTKIRNQAEKELPKARALK